MNVYSNLSHTAIKYIKDTEFDLRNLLVMIRDFNICDSLWDSSFSCHSFISDDLFTIADLFDLSLSYSSDSVPTRYLDNLSKSNSVIDLMFLWSSSSELNTHHIHPDWHCLSDHTPFMVIIPIKIEESGLDLFYFSFWSIFLFLEQLVLGLISHAITPVTTW